MPTFTFHTINRHLSTSAKALKLPGAKKGHQEHIFSVIWQDCDFRQACDMAETRKRCLSRK